MAQLNAHTIEKLKAALREIEYGNIKICIHAGEIVWLEKVDRSRRAVERTKRGFRAGPSWVSWIETMDRSRQPVERTERSERCP